MYEIEGRFTHSKTEGFEWFIFKAWVDSLDCTQILICEENKDFLTGVPVQPHLHAYFNSNIKQNSLRDSYKKVFKAKGNVDFKFSKVRDTNKYLRYICKCNNVVFNKGFTEEDLERYNKEFVEESKKIKEAKKKRCKNKIAKIKDFIKAQGHEDIGTVGREKLLGYIIKYHIDNDNTFSEFDLKRILTTILVTYQSSKARERYIKDLLNSWNL